MKQEKKEKKFISARVRRDFRYGTNALVLVAAVLVVFVLANLALESFSTQLTIDLTKEKLYSIGEVTDKNLKALKQDVEIVALYDRTKGESDSDRAEVIRVLDQYAQYDHVKISYKDPDSNPGLIRKLVGETDAASYSEGDYIVKCGDKTRRIGASDMFVYQTYQYIYQYKSAIQVEQKLTSAILFVTSDEFPVVYCATGHEERSRSEFTNLFNRIEALGCDIRDLDLAQSQAIPEDATVLIFLGPKYDLTEFEAAMVEEWLEQSGGQMIFCADYDQRGEDYERFNKILTKLYGLSVNLDLVEETEDKKKIAQENKDSAFIGTSVPKGPLGDMPKGYDIYLFSTRSVKIYAQDSDVTFIENYPLIQSAESGKSTDFAGNVTSGVQVVAATAVNSGVRGPITHAAVFGSTLGFSDEYYQRYEQAVLNEISAFGYTLHWMISDYGVNEGNLIEAKLYDTTTVVLDKEKSNTLAVVSMVVIPALIIGGGVVVWMRRRHL
ncbi:MAG: Gldg family protein [Clostridia bacterium]|nr:Gldg family protein [Clostridia bacterium]